MIIIWIMCWGEERWKKTTGGRGPTGNLASIYSYDENNQMLHRLHFSYVGYANKLKLNPVRSKLDPYLRIFGKGSVNMTSHEIRYPAGTNTSDMSENFTYVLDADGYPTNCTVVNLLTNRSLDQFAYSYKHGNNDSCPHKKCRLHKAAFLFFSAA